MPRSHVNQDYMSTKITCQPRSHMKKPSKAGKKGPLKIQGMAKDVENPSGIERRGCARLKRCRHLTWREMVEIEIGRLVLVDDPNLSMHWRVLGDYPVQMAWVDGLRHCDMVHEMITTARCRYRTRFFLSSRISVGSQCCQATPPWS